MKKLLLALLAVSSPAALFSQEVLFSQGLYNYAARPNRDRLERFQSARAEALGMSLATDDKADQLTLENWGDNRADLQKAESSIQPDLSVTTGERYGTSSKTDLTGGKAGVYGRTGNFEYEGYFNAQDNEPPSGNGTKISQYEAEVGYGRDLGGFSGGFHVTAGQTASKTTTESVTDNHTAGVAAVFGTGNVRCGLTLDYMMRGTTNDDAHTAFPLRGPALGAQALFTPQKGLKFGLRASYAPLSGDGKSGGYVFDYKANLAELGARTEWKLESLPLTLAAELSNFQDDPNYIKNGVNRKTENDFVSVKGGAALRLLDDRLMLGTEANYLKLNATTTNGASVDESTQKITILTGGAEFWVLPGLALRGSYSAVSTDDDGTDTTGSVVAGGLGYKSGDFTADLAARFFKDDLDAANPDTYSLVKLMASIKF